MSGYLIGILHPGEMGASIGGELVKRGHVVLWASNGRSTATVQRAEAMKMTDFKGIDAVVERVNVVLSICPPHAALDLAAEVTGFKGTFVDMNAISPEHARDISTIIEAGGGRYVDGGIIGLPVGKGGWTHLYLSGPNANNVAMLFRETRIETYVISDRIGDASALKMAYAAWTKGSDALLLAVRAFARHQGVEDSLIAEWRSCRSDLLLQSLNSAQKVVTKGWRWVGEMTEIASSFADAGLPEGFHSAAGNIFARSPRETNAKLNDGTLDRVLTALEAPSSKLGEIK